MPIFLNPETLEFKVDPETLPDFRLKTITPRLGEVTGSQHFKFDIRQLDPGMFSFPYHFHRNAEELMMIISGSCTVRLKNGFRIINTGEIVFFEMGESSAHQFYNHDSVPCIYLDIRTTIGIDVSEMLDSGKIYIIKSDEPFEKQSKVDYNKGEEYVREIWKKLGQDNV
jgi:uncharacterized cupin superfamily protein